MENVDFDFVSAGESEIREFQAEGCWDSMDKYGNHDIKTRTKPTKINF